jgi:hypothetical protein
MQDNADIKIEDYVVYFPESENFARNRPTTNGQRSILNVYSTLTFREHVTSNQLGITSFNR